MKYKQNVIILYQIATKMLPTDTKMLPAAIALS